MLYVVAACSFELNIYLRFGEAATADDVRGADGGVDPAVILGPRADSVAAVSSNGMEIGFTDLLLLLLGSHGPRMTCCAPAV